MGTNVFDGIGRDGRGVFSSLSFSLSLSLSLSVLCVCV